jgi:hypothetical protein
MAVLSHLLQQRHASYRGLLAVEVLALVGLRGLQQAPRLVSVVYLVISGVGVLAGFTLLPHNRLRPTASDAMPRALGRRFEKVVLRRRQVVIYWTLAVAMELVWQVALEINPSMAVQLSVLHLLVWLSLMLVLDPAAFNLPTHGHALPDGIGPCPGHAMSAFSSLTASVGITIVGQLYVAILIAGVLGKPRVLGNQKAVDMPSKPAAAPEAEHPRGHRAAAQIKLRRRRR